MPLPTAMLRRRVMLKNKIPDFRSVAGPTSLALIHSLIPTIEPSAEWLEQRTNEIEEFLKAEGITQATTLISCTSAEVVDCNPLLFEDSEKYSQHYSAIPFEV